MYVGMKHGFGGRNMSSHAFDVKCLGKHNIHEMFGFLEFFFIEQ